MSSGRSTIHRVALVAVASVLALQFWFVCDDAYITFRFARNWALGRGLVFNPGERPPVEVYSDFLWLLLAAAVERLRVAPAAVLPFVSAACSVVLSLRIYAFAQDALGLGRHAALLGALTFAASPAAGVWATSGLETMPHALLVFLLFERLARGRAADGEWAASAVIGMALALVRVEGPAWIALVVAAALAGRRIDGVAPRPVLERLGRVLAPVGLMLAMYTAWRYQYYGTLVPNTALVKVGFGWRPVLRGTQYLLLFWLTCIVPLLALLPIPWLLRGERRGTWAAVAVVAVAVPVYAVLVGGDFMPFGRLLVPGLPFGALLVAGALQEVVRRSGPRAASVGGGALVALGLLAGFDLHLVPEPVRAALHFRLSDKEYLSEHNRWVNQKENTDGFRRRGLALAEVADPGDRVVAAAVGAIGYYSDLVIYDQHGLVTKEVAYRAVPPGPLTESPGHDKHVEPEFFVRYEPRWLFAKAMWGKLAAGRMKDTLEQWDVDPAVMDRYVPEVREVSLPDVGYRSFLLVVRRAEPGEDPAAMWTAFPALRRELNAELRAQYADEPDIDGSPGG